MAINAAIAPNDARVRRVKKMRDGQAHVADWHAALDAENPILFRSVSDWATDKGGIPLRDFKGFK